MKKIFIFRGLLFVIILVIGCLRVNEPTQMQMLSAYYGNYPDNYQNIVKEYITDVLIDPNSAMYSGWKSPQKGWYARDNGSIYYGYKVCVFVNAKNRMGGYGGKKLFYFLIKDNKIIAQDGGDYNYGTLGEDKIYNLCK